MRVRHLTPFLAVAVAAAAVPTAASARSFTVALPKSITQYKSFAYTYEGDTGPTPDIGGGSIIRVVFVRGKNTCPVDARTTPKNIASSGTSENVFHSGLFRGADQTYFSRSGTVTVCGYLNVPGNIEAYELLFNRTVKVKALPRRAKYDLKGDALKSGTYVAGPADILGGGPTSTVTFVVDKGKVTSVSAAGIPNTACSTSFSTQTPVSDGVTSTTPKYTDNPIIGDAFSANFAAPTGDVSINAGAKTSKTIHGSLTENSSDGSCRGGFGFIAKR